MRKYLSYLRYDRLEPRTHIFLPNQFYWFGVCDQSEWRIFIEGVVQLCFPFFSVWGGWKLVRSRITVAARAGSLAAAGCTRQCCSFKIRRSSAEASLCCCPPLLSSSSPLYPVLFSSTTAAGFYMKIRRQKRRP